MILPHSYYRDLEERLRVVLDRVRPSLPQPDLSFVEQYLDHGEYGLAHDLIVAVLFSQKSPVPSDVVASLSALAETMELDATVVEWLVLAPPRPDREEARGDA